MSHSFLKSPPFISISSHPINTYTSQKLLISQLLVISLFDYADLIYIPTSSQKLLTGVQRVQNSCLRYSFLIYVSMIISPLISCAPIGSRCISVVLHLCCLVFRLLRSGIPRYLRSLLYLNSDLHSPDTGYHNFQIQGVFLYC